MKTNNLLTMLLYGLLSVLILAAGYKACEMQKDKKRLAQEEAELQKTLRDMGLTENDTTASGSAYRAGSDTTGVSTTTAASTATTPTTSKTGITQTAPVTNTTSTKVVPKAPTTAAQPTAAKPTVTTKPTTTTKGIAKTPKVAGPGNGRWAVRAGTFSSMAGARTRLEQVIKAGYPNAEISKTSSGMAAVVVYRSDNKTNAINVVDKLEEKGIDAAVFDRSKN